ncbi:MAG TPA: 4Fe-4S binding protein [Spirochaetota bacterium]|nr:4Fe-4S binding protein [Spirochaetota bacterium]HPC42093.1 4Fe-4S binding protein [Spirochaetota bacterium]HPL18816.1 4Fe-4S binding protein [Spirochaetota bacterium]HQF09047.1 4Fe-4S binding protein [Spirochaetota bacterium]HQH97935.1 4Fe-4S binding protein [Spirochaetota bacterium]
MNSKNVLLIFNKKIMYKPLIYRLARDFDVVFNVLEAKILPKLEGRLILELRGTEESINGSIEYLVREGVTVETLVNRIVRDDERCINCGACTSVCRVDALSIDRATMEVKFDHEKCVACGLCKIACPVGAMSGASIDLD